jgi:aryl-alcohol dehydrogenase-like predicted oxidoreductase
MTKCGRVAANEFNYHPDAIRASVKRSLERLQTNYLDTVYLHDIEFVCTPVVHAAGNSSVALNDKIAEYGLDRGQEGVVRGPGDQQVLDAFSALREMQEQGIIGKIGITGIVNSFVQSSVWLIARRLPSADPPALGPPHSSLSALQARRYHPFLLAPLPSE